MTTVCNSIPLIRMFIVESNHWNICQFSVFHSSVYFYWSLVIPHLSSPPPPTITKFLSSIWPHIQCKALALSNLLCVYTFGRVFVYIAYHPFNALSPRQERNEKILGQSIEQHKEFNFRNWLYAARCKHEHTHYTQNLQEMVWFWNSVQQRLVELLLYLDTQRHCIHYDTWWYRLI